MKKEELEQLPAEELIQIIYDKNHVIRGLEQQLDGMVKKFINSKEKMCYKKKVYFTKDKADIAAAAWNQRSYLCPHCHTYHLTTKE